jgi:hypothetical protein
MLFGIQILYIANTVMHIKKKKKGVISLHFSVVNIKLQKKLLDHLIMKYQISIIVNIIYKKKNK